jgi:mannose-6-phosphate isomerase-like protein (cupin superfamily)
MKTLLLTALFTTVLTAQSGAPVGFHVWTHAAIEAKGKALAPTVNEFKVASEIVATEGAANFTIAHREGSGQAEWHEKVADITVISSGTVTMVVGGTMPDGKVTAPGEMRGSEIRGGTEVKLGPGDILNIPPKTPHQMKLAPGANVTYFVAKVTE